MTVNAAVSELLLILFLAAPIGVAVYMFWLAWTRGGDSRQDAITVQYEPPDGLTPGECGALVDNAVALRGITATITDLSVKGYLTIEQKEASNSAGDHTDYVFHLTKPLGETGNLKRHEREVLTSIFVPTNPILLLSQSLEQLGKAHEALGHKMLASTLSHVEEKAKEVSDQYRAMSGFSDAARDTVALSDLQNHFALHLARIRDAIFDNLVVEGYYANRPDKIRIVYGMWGVFVALLMAVMGGVLASMTRMAPVALIGIGLFTGAIVLGFGFFLPARTGRGAQTLGKVLGFREFLGRAEKDHIERLEKTPELFEKYLPYAMALAVENRWTQTFATITVTPPQWYQGKSRDGFLPMRLTNDLNEMSNQAGGALAPSQRSSGAAGEVPGSVVP
jgi:Predicted membrane protein (DUF2207)